MLLPASNLFRDRIVADVRAALARAHNFNVQDKRAVEIIEWNKFLAIVTNLSLGLKILLAIIGTFTLSIGAVGVVNIMLVSVTERTREIGVLKALGARRRHILLQILFEGLVLTLTGGLLGFVLAALLVKLIGSLAAAGAALPGHFRAKRHPPGGVHVRFAHFEHDPDHRGPDRRPDPRHPRRPTRSRAGHAKRIAESQHFRGNWGNSVSYYPLVTVATPGPQGNLPVVPFLSPIRGATGRSRRGSREVRVEEWVNRGSGGKVKISRLAAPALHRVPRPYGRARAVGPLSVPRLGSWAAG